MKQIRKISIFFLVSIVLGSMTLFCGRRLGRQEQIAVVPPAEVKESTKKQEEQKDVMALQPPSEPRYEYVIIEEAGYLTVYEKDLRTVYLHTGIAYQLLPERIQLEIDAGKLFQTQQQLYEFLENYSS